MPRQGLPKGQGIAQRENLSNFCTDVQYRRELVLPGCMSASLIIALELGGQRMSKIV